MRNAGRGHAVAIVGTPNLQPPKPFWPDVGCEVKFLAILVSKKQLDGFIGGRRATSITAFGNPMQPDFSGSRNQAGHGHSDAVNRQDSASVFKEVHEGPAGSRLEPGSMVKGSAVV